MNTILFSTLITACLPCAAQLAGTDPPQPTTESFGEIMIRIESEKAQALEACLSVKPEAPDFQAGLRALWPKQLSNRSGKTFPNMNTKQNQNRPQSSHRNFLQNLLAGTMGILMACSVTACGEKNAQTSSQEIQGSMEERVTKITTMLSRSAPLPGPLLDAHFVEEKTGDGRLGPSDFKSFYALTVAPADLPAWKAALSKSKPANTFSNDVEIKRAAPTKAQTWWVNGADLGKLEFFSSQSLTGNANGWVGVSDDGRIYVHVFTM